MEKRKLIVPLLLLSIITIFLGISTAIFNYLGEGTTNNVIQTGRVVFSYSDAELGASGNGIDMSSAYPTPDNTGKILSNSNEYFDFSVTASTTNTDIEYEIVVNKLDNSTLEEERVKIYLVELDGDREIETEITGKEIVPTYDKLKDTDNPALKGKTVYYGSVKAGEVAYGKNFRLRMWIKDEPISPEDFVLTAQKEFSVKVNVAAIGNN